MGHFTNSLQDALGLKNITSKISNKCRLRAQLKRNDCFSGPQWHSWIQPCIGKRTLFVGWTPWWVGINGFYGFLVLWHVQVFFLFFISCLIWAGLGSLTALPGVSINSFLLPALPSKAFFNQFNYVTSKACTKLFLCLWLMNATTRKEKNYLIWTI